PANPLAQNHLLERRQQNIVRARAVRLLDQQRVVGRQQRENWQIIQNAGDFETQGDRVGTGQRKVEQHQLGPVNDRRQAAFACWRIFQFVRQPRQQLGGSVPCLPVADDQNA